MSGLVKKRSCSKCRLEVEKCEDVAHRQRERFSLPLRTVLVAFESRSRLDISLENFEAYY